MSKFKVGDIVKCIKSDKSPVKLVCGKIYLVVAIHNKDDRFVHLEADGVNIDKWWIGVSENRLELVRPASISNYRNLTDDWDV